MVKRKRPTSNVLDEEEFAIGTTHWVLHPENFPCQAEILAARMGAAGPQFYVHLCNFDKRLDRWIDPRYFLSAEERDSFWRENGRTLLPEVSDASRLTQRTLQQALRKRSGSFTSPAMSSAASSTHSVTAYANLEGPLAQLERDHEQVTRIKNIGRVLLGKWDIDCWYYSPYPDEYGMGLERLIVCEHCLKYMRYRRTLEAHQVHTLYLSIGDVQ